MIWSTPDILFYILNQLYLVPPLILLLIQKQCWNDIKNESSYKFVNFDIESFYPSITPELLTRALEWATQYTSMSEQQKRVVFHASKSFIYSRGEAWVKKGDINFDNGLGGNHGLLILSKLVELPNFRAISYRYDGLEITKSTSRQTEK